MKGFLFTLLLFFSFKSIAQDVEIIKLSNLEKRIQSSHNELLVFNFWASWCRPCVKEIPYFKELQDSEKKRVKVILVSMDFKEDLPRVLKILERAHISSTAFLIDEKDPEKIIVQVDSDWSGTLPATLFVTQSGRKYFHERAFSKSDLFDTTASYLNL